MIPILPKGFKKCSVLRIITAEKLFVQDTGNDEAVLVPFAETCDFLKINRGSFLYPISRAD